MSEISFFEVFAGTAVRSRPSSGRVSASSPCPSVPSRGLVPFRPRQPSPSVLLRRGGVPSFPVSLMSVFLLYLFLPGVPLSVPPWVARLRVLLLLRVFLCESLCPSSVVSSAPFPVGHSAPGPVACPCDSGPGVSACAVACLYCVCCLPVVCRRLPLRMRAAPRGSGRKVRGRRVKMPESAGRAGENRKKTEKVEKKSLKSLEIRQRALPLQSRSGRGPLGLLRGSGEVH